MYGVSLMIMVFTTLATALSGEGPEVSAVGVIIFWRVLLGIGIGGDYPMAAVITSEFASTRYRGRMMAAVFSMQGVHLNCLSKLTLQLGIITAALVYYFTILGFKDVIIDQAIAIPIPTNPSAPSAGLPAVDKAWRVVVGFGCIPALISLYYRLTIPETPRYTIDIERDIVQGTGDVETFLSNEMPHGKDKTIVPALQDITPKASRRDFICHFKQWKYGKVLLGTAGSWFMLDIAFYGLGLNNSVILQAIGYASTGSTYQILHNIAVGNLIIQCAGTLPGYWFAVAFIDIIGRKAMQIASFAILTTLFSIIGFAYWQLYAEPSKAGFIALFVMCQFFMNFGANTTTVCPSFQSLLTFSLLFLEKYFPLVIVQRPMESQLHVVNSAPSSHKSYFRRLKITVASQMDGLIISCKSLLSSC
jgi:MFS transporter, PHS family, inorganic phosphate transporter